MVGGMIRILISKFMIIPSVFSIPFPQHNVSADESVDSSSKSRILYWIVLIVGIAIFVEIIYWTFRCVNLVKRGRDNVGSSNIGVNRRRGLFDTPSYAGSIDEQLPPYEGFSLPKYNDVVNENISDEGTNETIQMVQVNATISDSNTDSSNSVESNESQLQIEPSPSLPQPPQPSHPSIKLVH